MRLLAASSVVLALACSGGTPPGAPSDSGAATDGTDGADGADGSSSGTDNDGDGFTVEEGDCDDDNIAVNPAREEDVFDGLDNDCDGRVDEEWTGLAVAEQVMGGPSRIVTYDTITRETGAYALPEGFVPFDNMKFYWFGPIVRGISWHPGGFYVAATPGTLWRIDADGTRTELASWAWDVGDSETFQLYAMGLAVDRLTGEVAILDLLGGLGSWTEAGGFVLEKQADLSDGWANWDAKLGVGVSRMDADGWWGMTADYETGEYSLSRFNQQDGDWVTRLDWANNLVRPLGVAAEGESKESYVTAKGGDYRTIWRLREQGTLVDDALAEVEDGKTFWGIMATY
jgi:hypothetical protein